MLSTEEAAQILYSNLSIADKDALLKTLLYEREAAIDVAATLYAAMTLAIMELDTVGSAEVAERSSLAIAAANNNKTVVEKSKQITLLFVEQKLEALR